MSTTDPQGFPDFQRFQQAAATPLVLPDFTTVNGNTTVGPFYVGPYQALQIISTRPVNNPCKMSVTALYHADKLGVNQTGFIQLACDWIAPINDVVPVLGNWVSFFLQVDTPGDQQYFMTVIPTANLMSGAQISSFNRTLLFGSVGPIAIGASVTEYAFEVTSGPGILTVRSDQGGFTLLVDAHAGDAFYAPILAQTVVGPTNAASWPINCPRMPLRFAMKNNSGAITNFEYSLVMG